MAKNKSENICVIGAGRFGSAVIAQLNKMNCSLMLIDKSEEHLKTFSDSIENIAIADAADIKALRALNIKDIDTVVVAVSDNIEIVASLLELKVKNIIARATSKRHALVLKQIGVNIIIQPEYEAGIRTALLAANTNFIKYSKDLQEIGNGFVMGTTYVINEKVLNKEIKDIKLNELGVSIVLIKRGPQFILPNGFTKIHVDDLLTIIGKVDDVNQAIRIFNKK
ncbi:TrkA family potassium uptake protein [Mycoplasma sp. 744]|uniref:potassium channel family protein n=1 Tax=unclassified Mycoplasma TaxID=2683645 RepID=UPI00211CD41C|nr:MULTISPECIES: TrkA family potassium uptake protein [unclassified Mycoplasma]MEA4115496.1 TrkA family potassium uptake protein [Mycoplasma sp. 744]UUM18995.1 TrkA family potassium uptake protein [Mycoplasma sp. 1018B]